MTHTTTITRDFQDTIVGRTSMRALVYNFEDKKIVERNIWKDENDRLYALYKGAIWGLAKHEESDYDYMLTFRYDTSNR